MQAGYFVFQMDDSLSSYHYRFVTKKDHALHTVLLVKLRDELHRTEPS
jgi:hypothetical protein